MNFPTELSPLLTPHHSLLDCKRNSDWHKPFEDIQICNWSCKLSPRKKCQGWQNRDLLKLGASCKITLASCSSDVSAYQIHSGFYSSDHNGETFIVNIITSEIKELSLYFLWRGDNILLLLPCFSKHHTVFNIFYCLF